MLLFIGKKGSGKTTLLREIFYHMRDRFDFVVALAGTPAAVDMFKEFVPNAMVYRTINLKAIIKTVQYARILAEKNANRRVLLVMDDCMGDKKLFHDPIFRDIAFNQRHLRLTFAVSMQYCMDFGPDLRTQVDYCFVFQENIISNRRRLWEYFFGMFEDVDSFSKILWRCTRNFECLVLDNTKNTENFADSLYFYKANPNMPPFRLGREVFWMLSEYYAVPEMKYSGGLTDELIRHLDVTHSQQTKDRVSDRLVVEKV